MSDVRPTILCVSANPALDRRVQLADLRLGEVNRARSAVMMPGGKSAHVAMASVALGARAIWLGFSGGSTGDENEAGLATLGIEVRGVRTRAATRVNLEAVEESGRITEVLEPGGPIGTDEQAQMLHACEEGLRGEWRGAAVAISGSLPAGVGVDFYTALVGMARAAGSIVFVDTSGEALRAVIGARPDFVKPNLRETGELLGKKLHGMDAAADGARGLIAMGVASAAVTVGADGLIWLERAEGPCWLAKPPKLKPISTVGCGDATLAGFIYAMQTGLTGEDAARLAAACGAANCIAPLSGQISEADVKKLLPQIEVRRLDP